MVNFEGKISSDIKRNSLQKYIVQNPMHKFFHNTNLLVFNHLYSLHWAWNKLPTVTVIYSVLKGSYFLI